MVWPLFLSKKILGIDIGTSAIRIVELSKSAERIKLENYGELESKFLYGKPLQSFKKGTLSLSTQDLAGAIGAICKEAKIRSRVANFALPDFSTFFTTFQLPPMTVNELGDAVKFEARQHVPLPVSEMVLDWLLVEGEPSEKRKESLKVLLIAVPKRVVEQYQEIANFARLKLQNLEAEVLALRRALINEERKDIVALVDIGAHSTTCSIIEGEVLKMSHSFDISGDDLTKRLVDKLDIDFERAEKLKLKYGLSPEGQVIHRILQPLFDSVIIEIEKILEHFFQTEGKEVQEVILAGGIANFRGVKDYFAKKIEKEVRIGDPFSNIIYPPILEKTLKEKGPSFAIAVGVAKGSLQ